MAKDFSFDVVSDYDMAEMTNAVDQAKRELGQRFDFKGTAAGLEFSDDKGGVAISGESKNQLDSILDMFQGKLVKRGVSLKVLDVSVAPVQGGKEMRWSVSFKKGLDQEKAKQITKLIRDLFPKAKAQIQGDSVRVSSTSKDDLQGIMTSLRGAELDFPLDFQNYR
ncbi:MAG TPA: YajQ family cyclic di-GMP-binding protein [Candidatus Saccharimonadia bacterium]|nr:YajQ family cyclic di-GMP-binding protein [Candidatus Saccharimonadia bacterium]